MSAIQLTDVRFKRGQTALENDRLTEARYRQGQSPLEIDIGQVQERPVCS
jgi:hypothetical protein